MVYQENYGSVSVLQSAGTGKDNRSLHDKKSWVILGTFIDVLFVCFSHIQCLKIWKAKDIKNSLPMKLRNPESRFCPFSSSIR